MNRTEMYGESNMCSTAERWERLGLNETIYHLAMVHSVSWCGHLSRGYGCYALRMEVECEVRFEEIRGGQRKMQGEADGMKFGLRE